MDNIPRSTEEYRQWYKKNLPEGVKWGECWCGCGTPADIASRTHRRQLQYKGEPNRFAAAGHNMWKLSGDLVGQTFGRWKVIGAAPSSNKQRQWKVVCECGTKSIIRATRLKNGESRSCGCVTVKYIPTRTAHGMSDHPLYRTWRKMIERCYNPDHHRYAYYGDRGITVCDRWLGSFENFVADIGAKPSPKHSLDRIDNNGPYSPENCQWATVQQQMRNKRSTRNLTYQGITKPASVWAEESEIPYKTFMARLYRGWSVERALTESFPSTKRGGK